MSANDFILSIDQGTTSTRALLFDRQGQSCFTAQQEFTQHFPADGWVEHDAEEILATTLHVCQQAMAFAAAEQRTISAIGITNQRETTVVWDRNSGRPLCNAIVWQDRRTSQHCQQLAKDGHETLVAEKTGLRLDPYFSASKLQWILQHHEDASALAQRGDLAFGTIDCYLIWQLTGGRSHATDATNASRTLLFNIHTQSWDSELLDLFDIPQSLLPEVKNSSDDYGYSDAAVLGAAIPITGVAGDQQAALIGQACFTPGMFKSTYGTGCFVVVNTGDTPLTSQNRLLTTVAYRLDDKVTYALEGSIFIAGAAMQWLRDGLGLLENAAQSEAMARELKDNGGTYLVPAFTGLGAPHWDPDARGAIFGLTRDTGIGHIVRAALEAVAYQSADLLTAMAEDGIHPQSLRVDGGMIKNQWLCQFLADVLDIPVARAAVPETTALGAAYLAGLRIGWYNDLSSIATQWQSDAEFTVNMSAQQRDDLLTRWRDAVSRVASQAN